MTRRTLGRMANVRPRACGSTTSLHSTHRILYLSPTLARRNWTSTAGRKAASWPACRGCSTRVRIARHRRRRQNIAEVDGAVVLRKESGEYTAIKRSLSHLNVVRKVMHKVNMDVVFVDHQPPPTSTKLASATNTNRYELVRSPYHITSCSLS